jgi:hypothetical protein
MTTALRSSAFRPVLVFDPLRRGPTVNQAAIIEFGRLGLVFLRHLPQFSGHSLLTGGTCISRAHLGEFDRFADYSHAGWQASPAYNVT